MRKSKKLISILMEGHKRVVDIATMLNLHKDTITYRIKELGIEATNKRFYDDYQIELISDFVRSPRTKYIIIESKIKSIKNFLIFDYDVAKRVYGNKNYTLDKQLRIILGGKFDKYKNDIDLKNLIEKLPIVKYTSDVTQKKIDS